MFADCVCDPHCQNESHRGWTTLLSFALQAMAVATLFALPFMYTQGLPSLLSPPRLLVPLSLPRVTQPQAQAPTRGRWVSIVPAHALFTPQHIPRGIARPAASDVQPPSLTAATSGSSRIPSSNDGIFNSTGDSLPVVSPHPLVLAHHPPVSRMMEGNLIHRVEPSYPSIAKQARIQGSVLLRATIGKDGSIENLRLLSGHPMLAQAAFEAVRQWRYRPYFLNGEPVEVETQVTVKFVLSGG
jgi:protein TonB